MKAVGLKAEITAKISIEWVYPCTHRKGPLSGTSPSGHGVFSLLVDPKNFNLVNMT